MRRSRSNVLKLVSLIGAVLLVLIFLLSRNSNPQLPPLPNPNGYDDFVAAAELLALREDSSEYDEWDEATLSRIVADNQPALIRLKQGLERECAQPREYKGLENAQNGTQSHPA